MSLMNLWLHHVSKWSNTPWKAMCLTTLAVHCYSNGSNLLHITHDRLSQFTLLVKINWIGKGVLTGFKEFNSVQLMWYFKHIPLKKNPFFPVSINASLIHSTTFYTMKLWREVPKWGISSINRIPVLHKFSPSHLRFLCGSFIILCKIM